MTGRQLFHVQFGVCQRSAGNHAVKLAAYQMCGKLESSDGQRFNFARKNAEHVGGSIMLPDGAPEWAADAGELWRQAEASERRADAQTARLIEFSIPRAIPADQRLEFACAIIQPYVDDGMAGQFDLHCTQASDGAEQPHCHVMLTMRRFDGDGFSKRKEREWNQQFTADKGRTERHAIAQRMNQWMAQHGIAERVDAARAPTTNAEPTPPKWQFERLRKTGEISEQLNELLAHRAARKHGLSTQQYLEAAQQSAKQASAEIVQLEDARRQLTASISPADAVEKEVRKQRFLARLLREHYDTQWLPPSVADRIKGVKLDREEKTATLFLRDGGRIVDFGDKITLHGKWNPAAITELSEAAARHGWQSVELTGTRDFKDALATELALRVPPIEVSGHKLSRAAQQRVDAELQRRAAAEAQQREQAEIKRQLAAAQAAAVQATRVAQRRPQAADPDAASYTPAPAYKPRFRRPPDRK